MREPPWRLMKLKEGLTLGVPTCLPLMPPGVTEVLPAASIDAAASQAAIETTHGSHRTFPDAQIIIPLKWIIVHRFPVVPGTNDRKRSGFR